MRVKKGTVRVRKRKRLLKHAKGFKWRRKNVFRIAKEAVHHSWANMYIGRKQRKRNMRQLWIVQINAAARKQGMSYSRFMEALGKNNIGIDRKQLSLLARTEPEIFKKIVEQVNQSTNSIKK